MRWTAMRWTAMYDTNKIENIAFRFPVLRAGLVAAMLVALAGCSSYEAAPEQSFDDNYRVFTALQIGRRTNYYFIKPYELDGKLAMCGGYTQGATTFSDLGSRNFADISQIYVDGSKIGNSDFMIEMPVFGLETGRDPKEMWLELVTKKPATRCVKSDVDWKPELLKAKFERKGPNRIVIFD